MDLVVVILLALKALCFYLPVATLDDVVFSMGPLVCGSDVSCVLTDGRPAAGFASVAFGTFVRWRLHGARAST